MPKVRTISFTQEQQDFINSNYLTMHDSKISADLGVRTYHIQQYRIENKLIKPAPNTQRVVKMEGKYFNVNEVENWVA